MIGGFGAAAEGRVSKYHKQGETVARQEGKAEAKSANIAIVSDTGDT